MEQFSPGMHLLIDHRGGSALAEAGRIETAMREAADDVGATILSASVHALPDGVSGAVILAEGHITVRTWVEQGYASFDVFLSGDGLAKRVADALARAMMPDWTQINAVTRNDFTPRPPAA